MREGRASTPRGLLLVLLMVWSSGVGITACANVDEESSRSVPGTVHAPDSPDSSGAPLHTRGRWTLRRERAGVELTAEQTAEIQRLETLGYVGGKAAFHERPLVRRYDPSLAFDGWNFHASGHGPVATLRDMQGEQLHRWERSFHSVWPDREIPPDHAFFRKALLLDGGHVLAIYEGHGIVRLDAESNVVWANPVGAHHDVDLGADGRFYVLTRAAAMRTEIHPDRPVLEDFVTVLDADGHEVRRHSLVDAWRNSAFADLWEGRPNRAGDVLHTNAISVLDAAGTTVLVSSLHLHALAVVDLGLNRVERVWTGSFRSQHDPSFVGEGNLLLFDNRGSGEMSRALEVRRADGEMVWEYRGTSDEPFRSDTCGTTQRLPNGNTLITETDYGRAFEVTPHGDIVWEFFSPHRAGENGEYVAILPELIRIVPPIDRGWLN